jgi:hypothetical protein
VTNEGLLQTLLEEMSGEFRPMPDDVFLVWTCTANRYYVVQLRNEGKSSFFFGDQNGDWSFDASTLDDIQEPRVQRRHEGATIKVMAHVHD